MDYWGGGGGGGASGMLPPPSHYLGGGALPMTNVASSGVDNSGTNAFC